MRCNRETGVSKLYGLFHVFLVVFYVGNHFRDLKSSSFFFLDQYALSKRTIGFANPRLGFSAHFAFSMQNCRLYFRWRTVLTVVTKPFLTGTKNVKCGKSELFEEDNAVLKVLYKRCVSLDKFKWPAISFPHPRFH